VWALDGPSGLQEVRVKGNIRSNSADLIREALIGGLGIGLRGTWEIGPEIRNGKLKVVLPQLRGSSKMAIYAVYPSRDFMPAKVDVFLEFLGQHFGPEPYWDRDLELGAKPTIAKASVRTAKSAAKRAGDVG
jgi:DNA-binding transcriptional LysR family regulator